MSTTRTRVTAGGTSVIRRTAVCLALALLTACGREPGPNPLLDRCERGPEPPRLTPPGGAIPCPTAAEIDSIDIPIFFEGDVSSTLVCREADGSRDLTQVQKNLYRALLFMRTVEFTRPLPWTHLTLWEWFRTTVAGIRIRTGIEFNFCCEPVRVVNLIASPVESTIPSFLEMLVHEARHANGPRHTCGGFDTRISEYGGFGVQYAIMQWVGSYWPGATPAEKEYALSRAVYIKWSSFCQECD